MTSSLGRKVRELRITREWTQRELSRRSGVDRGYLASIETGKVINPSADIFLKLARAFNIPPEELYQAAGYIKDAKAAYQYKESPRDTLDRLRLTLKPIPFYEDFELGAGRLREPADYVYPLSDITSNMEAYRVRGNSLEPEIKDKDIVVLDREAKVDNGDIIAVFIDGNIGVAKVKKVADEIWLENNKGKLSTEDCQILGVVIEIIRKRK